MDYLGIGVRWVIVMALTALLVSMAVGQFGISNYTQLLESREQLRLVNLELEHENIKLQEQIELLKTSKEAQLHYVKNNFGVVEKSERIYRFSESNNKDARVHIQKPTTASQL